MSDPAPTELPLSGRRLLVTGGSSGIGAATAITAARAGARVAVLARRAELLAEVAGACDGVAVPADIRDPAVAVRAVDRAADLLGGLDGVVNAAGLVRPATVADGDPAEWARMLEVNVLGLLHVTQPAIGHLRAAGHGDIVNISSMSGRRLGSVEMSVYAASKAAVHVVSEGLRRELTPDRIRVAVLAPGLVATGLFDGLEGEVAARMRARTAEVGIPVAEVADTVVRMLAAPPGTVHVEVALLALDQG